MALSSYVSETRADDQVRTVADLDLGLLPVGNEVFDLYAPSDQPDVVGRIMHVEHARLKAVGREDGGGKDHAA